MREQKEDVFGMTRRGYSLAHCISADFALGAGIAKEFESMYHIRARLFKKFGGDWYKGFGEKSGTCIATGPFLSEAGKIMVLNLVTKQRYWHKPTLENMRRALVITLKQCERYGITKLAMPRIGCGLDRLKWEDVSALIDEVFDKSGIDIVVCSL